MANKRTYLKCSKCGCDEFRATISRFDYQEGSLYLDTNGKLRMKRTIHKRDGGSPPQLHWACIHCGENGDDLIREENQWLVDTSGLMPNE